MFFILRKYFFPALLLAMTLLCNLGSAQEIDFASLELLKRLQKFEQKQKEDRLVGMVGEVRNGVLNVKAVNLKPIKPSVELYYKGKVEPPETLTVPFAKGGKIVSIIGKGEYVLNPIYDQKGNIIRDGNPIAVLDKNEIELRIKSAKSMRQLVDMSHEYITKMTSAQEKLAAQNYITSFAMESARMDLMRSLMEYESKSRDLDYFIASYKDNLVKSPHSGLVTEVFAVEGDIVQEGDPAMIIMKMDLVKIKIPFDVEVVNVDPKRNIAYIFPNGINAPVEAMLDAYQDDKDNVYAYVPNEMIDANRLTTGQRDFPRIFEIYPVSDLENRNIESFYLPDFKPNRNPLIFVPAEAIRNDAGGDYVFKVMNLNITTGMEKIPRIYNVKKVYVKREDVVFNLYYPYSTDNTKVSIAINPLDANSLKKDDMVVGKDDGTIADGKEAVIASPIWKFYPGQTVRVKIPNMTKQGIWVPRNAVIHNDVNNNFVYLVSAGLAKLTKVSVLGEYMGYCLIRGNGITPGAQIIEITQPEILDSLYDGMKIKVIVTQDPPDFMAYPHAIENLFEKKEQKDLMSQRIGKKSSKDYSTFPEFR